MKGQQITGLARFHNGTDFVAFGGNLPAGTYSMDCSGGNTFSGTLTGNVNINLRNLKPGQDVAFVCLQDGTGGRTITWGAADASLGQAAVTAATAGGIAPAVAASAETEFTIRGTSDTCVSAKVIGRAIV